MTAEKLKKVALTQFALHGYEGASLASIANDVGMKKQSIYSHFKSKEDLFLSTFKDSVKEELEYINHFFEEHQSHSLPIMLHNFLCNYLNRYNENSNTTFFMRTSFFPPSKLEQLVKDGTNAFVSEQEAIFLKIFNENQNLLRRGVTYESAALCFLTQMDGLFVEMMYGVPERLEKRTVAVWDIFNQLFSHHEKEKNNES